MQKYRAYQGHSQYQGVIMQKYGAYQGHSQGGVCAHVSRLQSALYLVHESYQCQCVPRPRPYRSQTQVRQLAS